MWQAALATLAAASRPLKGCYQARTPPLSPRPPPPNPHSPLTLPTPDRASLPCGMPRRSNLRILAAGGDGTVTWLLKTVRELQLEPPPAVAIMPLGTGNDLALSFGWGNAFLDRWIKPPQVL